MTTKKAPPWKKSNPVKASAHTRLSPAQKKEAKERADAAGRHYPNLVDNMAVAKKAKKAKTAKTAKTAKRKSKTDA